MSFSSEVKTELIKTRASACCNLAECYGMLLFSKEYSAEKITFITENKDVVFTFKHLVKSCFDVRVIVSQIGKKRVMYKSEVCGKLDCQKILTQFHNNKCVYLNTDLVKKNCCVGAFLRGAFLSCGTITDPQKSYHLEFSIKTQELAEQFSLFLKSNGTIPRIFKRNSKWVVYFKGSALIEEILTRMDASQHTLEIMGVKVYKDIRNKTNRINNCETANITKTVNAAVKQTKAIEILEKKGKLECLPQELFNVALLRKKYPNESLSELCKLTCDSLTRSGLNHRLQKIVKIADDINDED